jgi:THO complex subunit 1
VEELLDSQTIAGCQKIFDYLESRRERITAKHFKQKNLVILRSCNELLRRLSRADNTAFCGRVFIFMFQSFPLGDKSSVNLRGEYHVENVTTYDEIPAKVDGEEMDVDADETSKASTQPATPTPTGPSNNASKSVSFDSRSPSTNEKPLDPDTLYPIFWSLQESFNQPKKLFNPEHFTKFKKGLEATMLKFKSVQNEQDIRGPTRVSSEEARKAGTKRKRGDDDDDLANAFNPKYLTSRDLFELELSDLSFRRHVLVQALIIVDFLLSLSPKAKEKLATAATQNKSVAYQDQSLTEEDVGISTNLPGQANEL